MAKLGVLGAVAGGAGGLAQFLNDEQNQARKERLIELQNEAGIERDTARVELQDKNAREREDIMQQNRMKLEKARAGRKTASQQNLETLQEQGVEDAVDRVFPRGGRTGSTDVDVKRDFFKALSGMISEGADPQQAQKDLLDALSAAGLQVTKAEEQVDMNFDSREQAYEAMEKALQDAGRSATPEQINARIDELFPQFSEGL